MARSYKEHLEKLPDWMVERVRDFGVVRFTTYDHDPYGSEIDKDTAMKHLQRKGVEGICIVMNRKHECNDWIITEA